MGTETVRKIGQIAGSDSISSEQKKKALGALQQVGIIVGLDKELNKLHELKALGHSVEEVVDKYETICKASGIAQTIPMINLPNVTELMLDSIYAKSEHAEPLIEKVMTALGTSVKIVRKRTALTHATMKFILASSASMEPFTIERDSQFANSVSCDTHNA